jgi:hypothetical protein
MIAWTRVLSGHRSKRAIGYVSSRQTRFQFYYQTHPQDRREEKYEATSFSRTLLTVWVIQCLTRRTPAVALGCSCDGPSLVGLLVSSFLLALGESKPQAEKARSAVPVSEM